MNSKNCKKIPGPTGCKNKVRKHESGCLAQRIKEDGKGGGIANSVIFFRQRVWRLLDEKQDGGGKCL